jgi:hypothetical protein
MDKKHVFEHWECLHFCDELKNGLDESISFLYEYKNN